MPAVPQDLEKTRAFEARRRARQEELDRLYADNADKSAAALEEIAAAFARKHGLRREDVTMVVCRRGSRT